MTRQVAEGLEHRDKMERVRVSLGRIAMRNLIKYDKQYLAADYVDRRMAFYDNNPMELAKFCEKLKAANEI